jgi:hypothetical protein
MVVFNRPAPGRRSARGGAARCLSHCLDQTTHVNRLLEYRGDPKVSHVLLRLPGLSVVSIRETLEGYGCSAIRLNKLDTNRRSERTSSLRPGSGGSWQMPS